MVRRGLVIAEKKKKKKKELCLVDHRPPPDTAQALTSERAYPALRRDEILGKTVTIKAF